MDDIRLKLYTPVVTGTPGVQAPVGVPKQPEGSQGGSFQDVLRAQIQKSSAVDFSNHAIKRAAAHNIELTEDQLARLSEGVRLASEKNLQDPLILVGGTAFLVNVPNNTVITTMGSGDLRGNVFTNIDGTVIV